MWDQRQLEVPASGDLGKDKAMFWRSIQVFIFDRSCKLSGDWHGTNLNQVVSGNCGAETQKLEERYQVRLAAKGRESSTVGVLRRRDLNCRES